MAHNLEIKPSLIIIISG